MAKVKVIEFTTEHCGVCKMIAPAVDKAVAELGDSVEFEKLVIGGDIKVVELAQEYKVRSVPTFVFLKDGEPVHTHTGAISGQGLKDKVEDLQ